MSNHFTQTCDELDAELFSGDALFDPKALEEFERCMSRWGRRVAHFKEIIAERAGMTCHACSMSTSCEFAWDAYNTDGDCLAEK